MERYAVDRIEEGTWAVLEAPGGRTFDVPLAWLPSVKEGDVLRVTVEGAGALRFELDPEARQARLDEARARRAGLPTGPKGDVSL